MGRAEFTGICVPVSGYEDDYLRFVEDGKDASLGACNLMGAAGAESTRWEVVTAFGYLGTEHYEGTWQENVEGYRKEQGRQFPVLYRVKITVEAEPLSDEECETHWKRIGASKNDPA